MTILIAVLISTALVESVFKEIVGQMAGIAMIQKLLKKEIIIAQKELASMM